MWLIGSSTNEATSYSIFGSFKSATHHDTKPIRIYFMLIVKLRRGFGPMIFHRGRGYIYFIAKIRKYVKITVHLMHKGARA